MATAKMKRKSFGLQIKTFHGSKGDYLVMTAGDGKYHVYVEVEAKEAAVDCGCKLNPRHNNPAKMWKERRKSATQN